MEVIVGILVGILAVWALLLLMMFALRPKGVAPRELVGILPDLLRLLRSLITDRAVPLDVRVVLIGLLGWIVSPIDLIPEFIPVIGPLDDIVVAIASMRYVRRRMGGDELRRRWAGTPEGFALVARLIGA